nr:response regulator [Tumebacillus sp. BK434]
MIADDEAGLRHLLQDYFELNGYLVLTAKDGKEALQQAAEQPDLILLDINMPERDGLEVCRQIRNFVSCPILFLTARIEDADKIAGFQAGGDDYIQKPFSILELGARVEAHLRRELRSQKKSQVRFGEALVIDYLARELICNDKPVALSKTEFNIIELLSAHPDMVFDRERIYEKVRGMEAEGDSKVIAEHIRRIRAKLKVQTMNLHIERLEGYVETMSSIQKLEEMPVRPRETDFDSLIAPLEHSARSFAGQRGKTCASSTAADAQTLAVDRDLVMQVFENMLANGVRHAESGVSVQYRLEQGLFSITIEDDGAGFPEEAGQGKGGHRGLGLTICRALCEKHHGRLVIENSPHCGGAKVTASFLCKVDHL